MNNFKTNNLNKIYDDNHVLKDINFDIDSGITGILGINGAGKTTLMRIIAGLLDYDSGSFIYNKKNINLDSKIWREKIGYLPQSPGLYDKMTIQNFLDYMLLLSGWKNKDKRFERIASVIEILNLKLNKDNSIDQLSGGTRQRVAIAQAIIHNPDILLLDEPANNLDSEERNNFHNLLISNFCDKIVFYIGHIINELGRVCSKVIIISEGKICFYDKPQKLQTLAQNNVKELRIDPENFGEKLHDDLRILNIVNDGQELIIHYDKRFFDVKQGIYVNPTLEESYQILLNSNKI